MAVPEKKEASKSGPVTHYVSPFEEMERRFEHFFRRPFSLFEPSWFPMLRGGDGDRHAPTVDIFEEDGDIVVKAELPGMKKEEVDVKIDEHTVTISGEKKHEEKVEKKDFYREERSYGSFVRSFRLPVEVNTEKARASLKDGVLEVRVPKTESAKMKEKKISIE